MTVATGVGSLPGGDPLSPEADNAREYAEAVRTVLGELPDLPHVPELPGRGAIASMTGRTLAVVEGLAADVQPAGWRLTVTTVRPRVVDVGSTLLLLRAAETEPDSCGSSGENASRTRARAAACTP